MTYDDLMKSILTAQEEMLRRSIEANSVTLNGRKYGKLIENVPPNMKPTIFGMAVKADYAMPDDYDFLVQYEPPQPLTKTNADKIRAMSDEELAEWLSSFCACGEYEDTCPAIHCKGCGGADCSVHWLDWLRQEANDAL